jgi:hypothetical protein
LLGLIGMPENYFISWLWIHFSVSRDCRQFFGDCITCRKKWIVVEVGSGMSGHSSSHWLCHSWMCHNPHKSRRGQFESDLRCEKGDRSQMRFHTSQPALRQINGIS